MAKIAKQLTELVGKTPLLELNKFSKSKNLDAPVIAKVEYFNPGGSVKDRVALAMIEDAEQKGILKPGATIIEPTSGNTGVGLALVSAVKGYHLILTMPETMSVERRNLVKAYGAEVRLTSGKDGMPGAIKAAEALRDSIPGSVILQQFENPANPAKHYASTGPEIWEDTDGEVDIFVAGVGTGGTVTGIAKYLKEKKPSVKVYAVEPLTSPVLNGGKSGPHKIQGIGAGFVPKIYGSEYVDEVIDVDNDDAIRTGRQLAQTEGLLVGISSGAAAFAAALSHTRRAATAFLYSAFCKQSILINFCLFGLRFDIILWLLFILGCRRCFFACKRYVLALLSKFVVVVIGIRTFRRQIFASLGCVFRVCSHIAKLSHIHFNSEFGRRRIGVSQAHKEQTQNQQAVCND